MTRETPQQAFERLYSAHAAPLLAFLVYRTGDLQLAEDILADTFERVLKRAGSFDPRRGSEKTWLYTIALNRLRDHTRRAAAESRSLERLAVPTHRNATSTSDLVEDRDALARALKRLSAEEHEAVALRYGADLTIREIATIVRTPTTTVKGRLYHALRKLRAELGK
jgi:RNA polymerase sigma factor (sigma-70 family)